MRMILTCLAAATMLAGCSGDKTPQVAESGEPSTQTLASSIGSAPGLKTFGTALKDTGIATVFDGTAAYTVFAPTDDAFGKLGDAGKALMQPEQKAALAEVLRDHVVPGYLTPQDIDGALAAAKGKPVKMPTMGKGSLTFARSGEAITVTSADGAVAKFDGQPLLAGNGVAIPVDTVLVAAPGSGAAKAPAR